MADAFPSPRPSVPRRTGRIVFWVIVAAAAACFVAALLWGRLTVRAYSVPSGSMAPTVQPGDHVLASLGSGVRRGDIIILRLPNGLLTNVPTAGNYVKRVIGLPGDRVACCDPRGRVTVNGKPLNETYLAPGDPPSQIRFSVTLGAGQLWVLGDNRNLSLDSRAWGPVPANDVVGRVEMILHGGSLHLVRTPQTFIADGLAPADDRTPTAVITVALGPLSVLAQLALGVFGLIRTMIRDRRRRIRNASAAAGPAG